MKNEGIIHTKAIEVFTTIKETLKMFQVSKRKLDQEYNKGTVDIIIKKNYKGRDKVVYLIFLVKERDIDFFIQSWEIKGQFNEIGQELFYFIKSQILIACDTEWKIIPLKITSGINCSYPSASTDSDFLANPVHCEGSDGITGIAGIADK